MIICNNTAPNYQECLNITKPTWKGQLELYNLDADNFNGHCTNKIISIYKCLLKHPDNNIIYLDTDVIQTKEIPEDIFTHDILATRMVVRPERPYYTEVNAGVSFWKSNKKTIKFCEDWLELDKEYQKTDKSYPEQSAFNDLIYKGYDGKINIKTGNISENLYNFERDDTKQWINGIKEYNPYLIHMKQQRWKDEFSLNFLRTNGII